MGFGSGYLCLQGYLSFLELFHCLNLLSIFTARLLSSLTPAGQLQKLFVPGSCWCRSGIALSKLAVHIPGCPLLQLVPRKSWNFTRPTMDLPLANYLVHLENVQEHQAALLIFFLSFWASDSLSQRHGLSGRDVCCNFIPCLFVWSHEEARTFTWLN